MWLPVRWRALSYTYIATITKSKCQELVVFLKGEFPDIRKKFFSKGESPKLTRSLAHVIACPHENYVSWIATMTKIANFKSKKFFLKGEFPKLTRSLAHMIACLDESYVS